MAKRIITISREFGSGGRFIGKEVAKQLGIAYYDKNMINEIAEKSGLSPEYIQENAELSPRKGLFAYAFSGRDITGKSVEDMVYEAQRKVILDLAQKEPCVIVGRNADYILKDREDVLNVFIHGDMPEKIQRISRLYHVSEQEAVKMMADTNKKLAKLFLDILIFILNCFRSKNVYIAFFLVLNTIGTFGFYHIKIHTRLNVFTTFLTIPSLGRICPVIHL